MTKQLMFDFKEQDRIWRINLAKACCRAAARCEFDENIIACLQQAIISIARSES